MFNDSSHQSSEKQFFEDKLNYDLHRSTCVDKSLSFLPTEKKELLEVIKDPNYFCEFLQECHRLRLIKIAQIEDYEAEIERGNFFEFMQNVAKVEAIAWAAKIDAALVGAYTIGSTSGLYSFNPALAAEIYGAGYATRLGLKFSLSHNLATKKYCQKPKKSALSMTIPYIGSAYVLNREFKDLPANFIDWYNTFKSSYHDLKDIKDQNVRRKIINSHFEYQKLPMPEKLRQKFYHLCAKYFNPNSENWIPVPDAVLNIIA